MTPGQIANGIGSFLAMMTSGIFIVTWTLVGKWWKTSIGRFMIIKASAIFAAGLLTVLLTLGGFTPNVDMLRDIQAGIWAAVSIAFLQHTHLLWTNRKKVRKDD